MTVRGTDYEGTLAMGNVHERSIEENGTGLKWRHPRKKVAFASAPGHRS